tara:strand:- start:1033 stop:1242 length:210 start_codon:yes stop_codon:yes gene_type:complete
MEKLRKIVKMKWMNSTWGVFVGSILGYGYYYFFGCNSGNCSITSDPINSMVYGSLMGLILFWPPKKNHT